MSATTGTVTLHRVLRAPPERIYRAVLGPDTVAKWLPPHGFIPAMIPTEACYLGWQESLQLLALLVEAQVPG